MHEAASVRQSYGKLQYCWPKNVSESGARPSSSGWPILQQCYIWSLFSGRFIRLSLKISYSKPNASKGGSDPNDWSDDKPHWTLTIRVDINFSSLWSFIFSGYGVIKCCWIQKQCRNLHVTRKLGTSDDFIVIRITKVNNDMYLKTCFDRRTKATKSSRHGWSCALKTLAQSSTDPQSFTKLKVGTNLTTCWH